MTPPSERPAQSAAHAPIDSSTLYVVATPIGNLEDITLRALRILKGCSAIIAEDTRRTSHLLARYQIRKPLISAHKFNEARRARAVMDRLRRGESLALVSDSGTPTISDPGVRLIRAAIHQGLRVEAVPGACSAIAALSVSGLATGEFHFVGFLPHKTGQRMTRLRRLAEIPGTLIFFESPYRMKKLMDELNAVFSDRQVVVAREITKRFEEIVRGLPDSLRRSLGERPARGEFVVLVSERKEEKRRGDAAPG